jgi:hypothetical protein
VAVAGAVAADFSPIVLVSGRHLVPGFDRGQRALPQEKASLRDLTKR